MKLSVEAKVAASVAAAFVALTVGVIAQGNTADQSVGPNGIWHDREAGGSYRHEPARIRSVTHWPHQAEEERYCTP